MEVKCLILKQHKSKYWELWLYIVLTFSATRPKVNIIRPQVHWYLLSFRQHPGDPAQCPQTASQTDGLSSSLPSSPNPKQSFHRMFTLLGSLLKRVHLIKGPMTNSDWKAAPERCWEAFTIVTGAALTGRLCRRPWDCLDGYPPTPTPCALAGSPRWTEELKPRAPCSLTQET